MTITELPIELDLEEIAAFCKQWHIAKLEIFGSVLRSDFRSDSDLDFLYPWHGIPAGPGLRGVGA
jgi:hypothetical protein